LTIVHVPQAMVKLATLMESCDRLVKQPGDWRVERPLGLTHAEQLCSLVTFDALCTLSEYHHHRGDVDAALGWARRALLTWFAATTAGQDGDGIPVSC
jgi:hypothetical protein